MLIAGRKDQGGTKIQDLCPLDELMGALLAVRLALKILDSLRIELEAVWNFTDSSAVLGMLSKDSSSFLEFVGTRVSEIKTKSDPYKEWFWIPGELNLADMGTRPTVGAQGHGAWHPIPGRTPLDEGPTGGIAHEKTFSQPPSEECRKDMLSVAGAVRVVPYLWYPLRATTRGKLERIYG